MLPNHQQCIPADMESHPYPGEREIYRKPAATTHHERPAAAEGARQP